MTIQRQLWCGVVAVAVAGCAAEPVRPDLDAVDANSRIAAIVAAADSDDPAELPKLVEALEHDDPAVRLFAIEALERRTGETFGYEPYDPPTTRADAVGRWQDYLAASTTAQPSTAPRSAVVDQQRTASP